MKLAQEHSSELNQKIIAAIDANSIDDFPNDIDINGQIVCDHICYTPLTYAAMKGSPQIIQHILLLGGLINLRDNNGLSPLATALAHSKSENLKQLLNFGANCSIPPETGWEEFTQREDNPHASVLDQYLQQRKDGLDDLFKYTNNIYVNSFLEVYVHSTSGECVKVLLDHIYDNKLETSHNIDIIACKAIQNPTNFSLILEKIEDEQLLNYLLSIAILYDAGAACRLLLAKISRLEPTIDNIKNIDIIDKLPLLIYAINSNSIEAVSALCESQRFALNKKEWIIRDDKRLYQLYPAPNVLTTALIFAIENGKTEIAVYLCSLSEVNVNLRADKLTPLQLALIKGNKAVIDALLDRPDIEIDLNIEELKGEAFFKFDENILMSVLLHDKVNIDQIDESFELYLVTFPHLGKILASRRLLDQAYQDPSSPKFAQLILDAYLLCPTVICNRTLNRITKYIEAFCKSDSEGNMSALAPIWISESFASLEKIAPFFTINQFDDTDEHGVIDSADMALFEALTTISLHDKTLMDLIIKLVQFIMKHPICFKHPYELASALLQNFRNDDDALTLLNINLCKLANLPCSNENQSVSDNLNNTKKRHAMLIALAKTNLYRRSILGKLPPVEMKFVEACYRDNKDQSTLMWNIILWCESENKININSDDETLAIVVSQFQKFIFEQNAIDIRKANGTLVDVGVLCDNFSALFSNPTTDEGASHTLSLLNWE